MTWLDPQPFLRGVAWLDQGRPVRADPADLGRLPWHTAVRAELPIGVRLEFATDGARAVEIHYRSSPDAEGSTTRLPDCFALWQRTGPVSETLVDPTEEGIVTLPLPKDLSKGSDRWIVHPPETRSPLVLGVRAIGGSLAPPPEQPRWLVHGDSITEGWWSTRPAHSWPARAGRLLGLDTVNLGYAGSAHGEPAIAEQLSTLSADAVTLAFGTNCWSEVPYSPAQLYETVRTFLAVVRQGHPRTPLLVVSPCFDLPLRMPGIDSVPRSPNCARPWSRRYGIGSTAHRDGRGVTGVRPDPGASKVSRVPSREIVISLCFPGASAGPAAVDRWSASR